MEFKGTKGKWVNNDGNIVDENNIEVVDIITLSKEDEANALLISKAPEMLDMLQRIMSTYDKGTQTYLDCQQLIKQATEL